MAGMIDVDTLYLKPTSSAGLSISKITTSFTFAFGYFWPKFHFHNSTLRPLCNSFTAFRLESFRLFINLRYSM